MAWHWFLDGPQIDRRLHHCSVFFFWVLDHQTEDPGDVKLKLHEHLYHWPDLLLAGALEGVLAVFWWDQRGFLSVWNASCLFYGTLFHLSWPLWWQYVFFLPFAACSSASCHPVFLTESCIGAFLASFALFSSSFFSYCWWHLLRTRSLPSFLANDIRFILTSSPFPDSHFPGLFHLHSWVLERRWRMEVLYNWSPSEAYIRICKYAWGLFTSYSATYVIISVPEGPQDVHNVWTHVHVLCISHGPIKFITHRNITSCLTT